MFRKEVKVKVSVISDSLQPHGPYRPWNSPGQNCGVGSLSLLQGIFPTQGSNQGFLYCRRILYQLSHKGSPRKEEVNINNDCQSHPSVCSSVLCLVTTKNWSDGHQSPWRVTALGSWTNRVIALRQISVTALFYLEDSRRIHPRNVRTCQPKGWKRREWRRVWGERERRERVRERERAHACGQGKREKEKERERARASALAPPFICFFLHLGLPYANWAQPGVLFVLPEVFTLVLGPSFDLPCRLTTAILDSFSLFYLPNTSITFIKCQTWC